MKKRIVALLIAGTMALSLSACGGGSSSDKSDYKQNGTTQETKKEEEKAPVDLAGTWKSEDNDGSWMEAVIADDTITVNWVSDNGDTTSIYWVGTYTAPTEYSADYTWTSDRNKEQTDNAMLASTDDTKDFSYSDADKELSYQVSMAGTTTKVKLTKAE